MARASGKSQRLTLCTNCNEPLLVDRKAKSISCAACNGRVITEPMAVKDYVAVRNFNVANHMHITKKGHVVAKVRADELDIDGRLKGGATAIQRMHVSKKAEVHADLRATVLTVEPGAEIVGYMQIGPASMPELDRVRKFAERKRAEAAAEESV